MIMPGVNVGDNCIIGAVVTHDVPPWRNLVWAAGSLYKDSRRLFSVALGCF